MNNNKYQYCGIHLHKDNFKTYYELFKHSHKTLDCNSFQIFLSSPYSLQRDTKISTSDIQQSKKYLKENKINLICHSGYLINLCSSKKHLLKLMIDDICNDLKVLDQFDGIGVVIHFGKAVDLSYNDALKIYIHSSKKILSYIEDKKLNCKLIFETSAAQGTTICNSLEQLKEFYSKFTFGEKKNIGFCIDSCHIFQAGYDIRKKVIVDNYFKKFDEYIGKDKLLCFHINDSKNKLGDGVDRHEDIFKGKIGNNLKYFIKKAISYKLPMILETPNKDLKELNKLKKAVN